MIKKLKDYLAKNVQSSKNNKNLYNDKVLKLRIDLIKEEVFFRRSYQNKDLIEVADAF